MLTLADQYHNRPFLLTHRDPLGQSKANKWRALYTFLVGLKYITTKQNVYTTPHAHINSHSIQKL